MAMQKVIVSLELDVEKEIPELDNKIAQRAYTIDGVRDVRVIDGDPVRRVRESCARLCEGMSHDRGMFHPDDEDFKQGALMMARVLAFSIRREGQP